MKRESEEPSHKNGISAKAASQTENWRRRRANWLSGYSFSPSDFRKRGEKKYQREVSAYTRSAGPDDMGLLGEGKKELVEGQPRPALKKRRSELANGGKGNGPRAKKISRIDNDEPTRGEERDSAQHGTTKLQSEQDSKVGWGEKKGKSSAWVLREKPPRRAVVKDLRRNLKPKRERKKYCERRACG